MSDKLPAFQFYPGDWKRDPGVQSLNYEERGIWFEILLLMHESSERGKLMLNGRAMTEKDLADVLHLGLAKVKQTIKQILSKGVASRCQITGALVNRRMLRDEHLRQVRAEAGAAGGKQKASNMPSKTEAKATPSSSSSVSSSSSSSIKKPIPTLPPRVSAILSQEDELVQKIAKGLKAPAFAIQLQAMVLMHGCDRLNSAWQNTQEAIAVGQKPGNKPIDNPTGFFVTEVNRLGEGGSK